MRTIAAIVCVIVIICFIGLPFIGLMIMFGLFYLLLKFALGGK
ncbi:hypothetical protein [Acinetobacter bereziniae]|nr:hypothetical protein [Acinetobacter bereziniae]